MSGEGFGLLKGQDFPGGDGRGMAGAAVKVYALNAQVGTSPLPPFIEGALAERSASPEAGASNQVAKEGGRGQRQGQVLEQGEVVIEEGHQLRPFFLGVGEDQDPLSLDNIPLLKAQEFTGADGRVVTKPFDPQPDALQGKAGHFRQDGRLGLLIHYLAPAKLEGAFGEFRAFGWADDPALHQPGPKIAQRRADIAPCFRGESGLGQKEILDFPIADNLDIGVAPMGLGPGQVVFQVAEGAGLDGLAFDFQPTVREDLERKRFLLDLVVPGVEGVWGIRAFLITEATQKGLGPVIITKAPSDTAKLDLEPAGPLLGMPGADKPPPPIILKNAATEGATFV